MSRRKQQEEDPQKLKDDQNRWKGMGRLVDSEKKRLRKFKRNTMYNAIFTCMCCHRNLFECNVSKFTTQLLAEIETKNLEYIRDQLKQLIICQLQLMSMEQKNPTFALHARSTSGEVNFRQCQLRMD